MITAIVAMGSGNRVIGNDGQIPWRCPKDLKRFRDTTMGYSVIMGRKTYDSLPDKFRPLPGRQNIILSRNTDLQYEGAEVTTSAQEALDTCTGSEIFVIGGEEIYKLFWDFYDQICLTLVSGDYEGDTFFPLIDFDQWVEQESEFHSPDIKNPGHSYFRFKRKHEQH